MPAGKLKEPLGRICCSKERTPVLEWNDFIFRAVGDQHRCSNRPEVFPRIVTDARQLPYRKIRIDVLRKIGHGSEAGSNHQCSRFLTGGQPCANGTAQRFAE